VRLVKVFFLRVLLEDAASTNWQSSGVEWGCSVTAPQRAVGIWVIWINTLTPQKWMIDHDFVAFDSNP
jgi:hypothetical protein